MAESECVSDENVNKKTDVDVPTNLQIGAVLSYVLIIVFVGIPLWWKTTTVYRHPLPYDEIHSLDDLPIQFPIHITVIAFDESMPDFSTTELALEHEAINVVSESNLKVKFVWDLRYPIEREWQIYKLSSDLNEMDLNLFGGGNGLLDVGAIKVALLPRNRFILPNQTKFYIGRHRTVFASFDQDLKHTLSNLVFVLKDVVNLPTLRNVYNSISGLKKDRPDKTLMRTVPSSSEVDVTFTLILPESSLVNLHWDIEDAVNDYLEPFKKEIQQVLTLKINSQVSYLMYLDIRPHYDSDRKHYALDFDKLPHIVNPIEAKLGSYVSTNPRLNFVVYVPQALISPLQIYEEDGNPSFYNTFLIPRWGGFLVHNVKHDDVASGNASLDMRHVMGVFLAQLRPLLGIPNKLANSELTTASFDQTYLHQWELDNLMRIHLVENLVNSMTTLKSLAQLLEEIGSIVISDHVGEQVLRSLNSIFASCEALRRGNLRVALSFSKESFVSSETAFFDPSMLALLYFPEDQKYAIYVPLFLPVSIPLLWSLKQLVKWQKHRATQKREKLD